MPHICRRRALAPHPSHPHPCHPIPSVQDSVLAMLEAFVHDPLINWRLLNTAEPAGGDAPRSPPPRSPLVADGGGGEGDGPFGGGGEGGVGGGVAAIENGVGPAVPTPPADAADAAATIAAAAGDATEALNERAVAVVKRMSDKLTGRDWAADGVPGGPDADGVAAQVERLIQQATSHENLCQSYIGWCAFW